MKTSEAIQQLNNATTQRLTVWDTWGSFHYDFPWGMEALAPRHRAIVQDPLSGHWECIAVNDRGVSLVFQYVPAETLEQKINRLLAAGWTYKFWHPGTGNGEDAYHWTPPVVFQSNRHGKATAMCDAEWRAKLAALKADLKKWEERMPERLFSLDLVAWQRTPRRLVETILGDGSPFPAPASNYAAEMAALKEELDRHADQMRAILLKFFRENGDNNL